jgi:hypothetical protein
MIEICESANINQIYELRESERRYEENHLEVTPVRKLPEDDLMAYAY